MAAKLARRALGSRLRPGEATGLTWDRVDLDAGRLTIDRARVDTPDGMALAAPKGGEDGPPVRTVEIPGPLVAALKAHQARQREEIMRHRDVWPDTAGLMFTSQLGTMIDRGNLRRGFSALAERAGLGADWHPHEARHLYVSQCVDAGLTMTEVADAVGHACGSRTTARVYSHRMRDAGGSGAKAAIEARYGAAH